MQGLVTLFVNSLYGVQIRRDANESYYCKPETWMKTKIDENVSDYWKLANGNYIVKMKKTMDYNMTVILKILYLQL